MKTIRLILTILLAAGLTSSRAQNTWTQKADFGGTARSSASTFSIGDKGYLGIGGTPTLSALFKDFWEYNPGADSWTQKADFGGGERAGAIGLSINGKGYIGTGFSGSFWGTYYNDFWEYDPVANVWTKKADFGGVPRSEAGGFTIGDKGYIGTGFTYTIGEYYSDFWEYDPAWNVWTKKADFGGGDWADPTAFSIGNKGYMGTGWKNGLSASFYEYDPATDTWTKKANYGGGAIQYSVGFSIGNKGYIGTGVGIAVFYEYDPDLNKWTKKADYGGGGVNVAAGFSIGNKGYIGTGQTNVALKSFWEYTPETETSCFVNALNFDGINDAVSLAPAVFGGNEFHEVTVEAWIRNSGYTGDYQAVVSSSSSGNFLHLQCGYGGNNVAYVNNGVVFLPMLSVKIGEWRHIAVVYKSGDSRLYENGILIGSSNMTFGYITASPSVFIGQGYLNGRKFLGDIDEVRIWNVARSGSQISGSMYSTLVPSENPGLIAYYQMNQGIAGGDNTAITSLTDATTNHFEGTLSGFALDGVISNFVANETECQNNIVCVVPQGESTLNITSTSATLSWDDTPGALGYVIKYDTKAGDDKAMVTYSKSNSKPISNLKPNTTYFWRVKSVCSEEPKVVSEWSDKKYFTTGALKIGKEQATSFKIYPNPVADNFTLDLQFASTVNQSATIYLLNSLGQIVFSSNEITGNGTLRKEISMPLTASSGWYIVRVVLSDQVMEKKLLYQK